MTGKNNSRVTMAVLGEKLDNALDILKDVKKAQEQQGKINTALQVEDAKLHGRIDKVDERVSNWRLAQTGLSAVMSAIAAAIGYKN